jgi:hypothetical protein
VAGTITFAAGRLYFNSATCRFVNNGVLDMFGTSHSFYRPYTLDGGSVALAVTNTAGGRMVSARARVCLCARARLCVCAVGVCACVLHMRVCACGSSRRCVFSVCYFLVRLGCARPLTVVL